MADQFKAVVEQAIGRQVRSFFSDTDLEQDISAARLQPHDMSAFEPEG